MGEAKCILGIDIKRDRAKRSISIGQSAYFNTLLQRHGLMDCDPVLTPMDSAATHEPWQRLGIIKHHQLWFTIKQFIPCG